MEVTMSDIMFEAPSNDDMKHIVVTKELVEQKAIEAEEEKKPKLKTATTVKKVKIDA